MRDVLAERLLAQVMEWGPEDIARERPWIQAMADYKYDEYRQFSPGMRFTESLALWLRQFDDISERQTAYAYIRSAVVFFSQSEVSHFVAMAYPDHVKPRLLSRAAADLDEPVWRVSRASLSPEFRAIERKTLFLGLSDGAHTDMFRRANPSLSHEQMGLTYEVSRQRAAALLASLRLDLGMPLPGCTSDELRFSTLVLLDDFAGSGVSYIRKDGSGAVEGKVAKLFHSIYDSQGDMYGLFDVNKLVLIIVLYIATEHARMHIETLCQELWAPTGTRPEVVVVSPLSSQLSLIETDPFWVVAEKYYDAKLHDSHMARGGTPDSRFGFAGCALPVVLFHNTPNNSVALLWSYEADDISIRGLFPRVRRHKEN